MLKILIVEDNLMIADFLEEFLVQCDYDVCGIASTVASAVEFARLHRPDVVILDQRLAQHGLGTDVAAALSVFPDMGILYVTGNMDDVMNITSNGHACLAKPYRLNDMLRSIEIVAGMVTTGTASQPFPRGFQVLPSAVAA